MFFHKLSLNWRTKKGLYGGDTGIKQIVLIAGPSPKEATTNEPKRNEKSFDKMSHCESTSPQNLCRTLYSLVFLISRFFSLITSP